MKTSLRRIITPPPLPPSSLMASNASAAQVASQALAVQLSKAIPFSASAAAVDTTGAASSNNTSTRIRLLTVHPSLPYVAYVLVDLDAAHLQLTQPQGKGANSTKPISPRTMLVVQDWHTRKVVWSMTLLELSALLFDQDALTTSAEKQVFCLQKLGAPSFLEFYDPATLLYSGMTTDRSSASSTLGAADPFITRWQGLMVHFSNQQHIALLNLRRKGASLKTSCPLSSSPLNDLRPLLADLTPERAQGSTPSSNVLPISERWWLVATANGNLLCWDWTAQSVHQVIKPTTATPMGKNDAIVYLGAVNSLVRIQDQQHINISNASTSTTRRIVTCTKSHVMFVSDCVISTTAVEVCHPLIQLIGGVAPMFMPCTSEECGYQGWLEPHKTITYDPVEDYLYWNSGNATAKQQQGGCMKLLGWKLDNLNSNNAKIPIVPAEVSVTLVPPSAMSTLADAPLSLVASWWHPAFGSKVLSCAVIQRTGDLQVLAANLTGPLTQTPSQQQQQQTTTPSKSGQSASTTVSLSSARFGNSKIGTLWSQHRDIASNPVAPMAGTQLRVYGIGSPRLLDASMLILATNAGLLVVEVASCNAGVINITSMRGAARHCHFGATAAPSALQKSVLLVRQSNIVWAQIDFGSTSAVSSTPTAASMSAKSTATSPPPMLLGLVPKKSPVVVYESPAALHLPVEIQRRKVRLQPRFLPSPSGSFVCLWWPQEMRYEVLHMASMLNKSKLHSNAAAASSGDSTFSTAVASGINVLSFAWINAEDVFAVLHAGDDQTLTDAASSGNTGSTSTSANPNVSEDESGAALGDRNVLSKMKSVGGAATGALGSTMKTVGGGAFSLGSSTLKKTTGALKNITQAGAKITKLATTPVAGGAASDASHHSTESTDDDSGYLQEKKKTKAWVEIKILVHVQANASDIGVSIAAATASSMGELTLRGGNRNIPAALFSGPVLCVATREPPGDNPDDIRGLAYFYTRKRGSDDPHSARANEYVSSGPALPYPDLVEWDEDGRLCAMVIQSRVAIYLSDNPDFMLLGAAHVGSPNDRTATVISVKFVHGVLYATTRSSVHCIFLGDLENGICHLDCHILASTHVPTLPVKSIATNYKSLMPPILPMPLNQPVVLGYQSGSLLLSTVIGLMAIPLSHPLLRIGSLLGAGQTERAKRWFDAIPPSDHEGLANFLERRGFPELALHLPGLSLETMVDTCMRHGFNDHLQDIVEAHGVKGLRSIDLGRGVSSSVFGAENHGHSVVVSVAAYLLSQGNAELVRRLATECLGSSKVEGSREAFILATLLMSVDNTDAQRLIQRAVDEAKINDTEAANEWLVGKFMQGKFLLG